MLASILPFVFSHHQDHSFWPITPICDPDYSDLIKVRICAIKPVLFSSSNACASKASDLDADESATRALWCIAV